MLIYCAPLMREAEDQNPGIAACSDAERRRAGALAEVLRSAGRDVRVVTIWVRPAWWLIQVLCAGAGVAASVVAVDHQITGLAVAAGALLIALVDLVGNPLTRRMSPARATQNVISTPPPRAEERAVTVILTAALDDARPGAGARLPFRLTTAALAALALLTLLLGVRAAGADGRWLDILQLLPTLALLAAMALLVEGGLTAPKSGSRAAEAAIVAASRLDAIPPRNLDVAIVLAGAGSAHAAGLSTWLRDRRTRGLEPSKVAIVHFEPHDGSAPIWWERDGPVIGSAIHPQLISAARGAAQSAGGQPGPRRAVSTAAGIVHARGWPAIAIGADAAFAQELITALDPLLDR